MKPFLVMAFLLVPAAVGAQGTADSVATLMRSGDLAGAERLARAGGDADAEILGEVLAQRGRLAEADSIFAQVSARHLPRERSALAASAEIALRRGDRATAVARARDAVGAASAVSSRDDDIARGRAFVVLGNFDPTAFHDALAAFDAATAIDSNAIESQLRAADLLLDRYNAPDARAGYDEILRRVPRQPEALLGLARADAFEGKSSATDGARAALARDTSLVAAWLLLGEQHLEAEAYDSATMAARHALANDSSAEGAWGILGAVAWLRGDSAEYRSALAGAARINPHPADFFAEISESAGRQRRYDDAVRIGRLAIEADSMSARAWGTVAENELRTGAMAAGRSDLERAFALDPYNLWHKNTLDLLDHLATFRTIATPRFVFVAPPSEAAYLALYLGPLLDSAYDTLAVRYQYQPPTPIRIELYDRHADFSVRTVGLTGLGALGVSFGSVLILDSPRARDVGELNYGSTAWHELTHSFTLGLSRDRMPRWFSEGLSVLEERRAGRGWGENATVPFLLAFRDGKLPRATEINEALVRPRYPEQIEFGYYEASLVCQMIEERHGIAAIRAMLKAWGDGLGTPDVLQRTLGISGDSLNAAFDIWVQHRFAPILASLDASDRTRTRAATYTDLVREGSAALAGGARDSGRALLHRAEALFSDDGSDDSPAWILAHDARDHGDIKEAVAQIRVVTLHNETIPDANRVEAGLELQAGDTAAALASWQRQQWITPYDAALHDTTARIAESLRRWPVAIAERRAILALGPADSAEAGYQLARVLSLAGDRAAARREVLNVLERAPAFEKAQALLLDLDKTPGGKDWL